MDLRTIPRRTDGENLEDYLRRVVAHPSVSVSELALHLDVLRNALYKIKKGGGADPTTLTRFGALTGVISERDEPVVALLEMLLLLPHAQAGWAERRWLVAGPDERLALEAPMKAARAAASRT